MTEFPSVGAAGILLRMLLYQRRRESADRIAQD